MQIRIKNIFVLPRRIAIFYSLTYRKASLWQEYSIFCDKNYVHDEFRMNQSMDDFVLEFEKGFLAMFVFGKSYSILTSSYHDE